MECTREMVLRYGGQPRRKRQIQERKARRNEIKLTAMKGLSLML